MKFALSALLAGTFLALSSINAQTSATSPAPDAPTAPAAGAERDETTGTITDVMPDRSLVLHTGTNAGEDRVFRFAPKVTYVDEDGRVVEAAGLRKNLRVRVSYLKSGADHIVDKVTILE